MRILITATLFAALALMGLTTAEIRLIGTGCQGTIMPLLAAEEDHLPPCKRIERLPFVKEH